MRLTIALLFALSFIRAAENLSSPDHILRMSEAHARERRMSKPVQARRKLTPEPALMPEKEREALHRAVERLAREGVLIDLRKPILTVCGYEAKD